MFEIPVRSTILATMEIQPMNTLPRAVTAQFFPNINSYNALRQHWSVLMNSERRHSLSPAHHLLYLALRGKDWRKAFTCVTNQRKLENGAFAGWAFFRALEKLRGRWAEEDLLAPFDGLVTPEMLQALRGLLPSLNAYAMRPEEFARRNFPFDAYRKIETTAITITKGSSHD
jgi:hypothetical protein